ncbi:PVC-type heme-binding CxxCH protein [Rubinisphaera italica]|uniref:Trehalose utilization n=1 Tax=Rubinisphaera italica TaxID=2527969 RepID=A0A5C5XFE1_9PLAN|nr:PVC-type heme-binding CxxCH protein [Rubinisphaera italica]TWT60865.1 Trehalose utilization [Rubinisphaera italica]
MRNIIAFSFLLVVFSSSGFSEERSLNLLFLGDQGHHNPQQRFYDLAPHLAVKGIKLEYTENIEALNNETLEEYDGLVLYANIDSISKEQADALLKYVTDGHGFIPLHCATFCFRNDPRMVALMGAQFMQHGTGIFKTVRDNVEHPVLDGFKSFTSWDETYLHHLHNTKNRTVLEFREGVPQEAGNTQEPWTWVRTQEKGRVFYTAWGHDERTWTHPGFLNLVERGIRWACGDDPAKAGPYAPPSSRDDFVVPEMTTITADAPKFEYVDVGPKIPDYKAGRGETRNLMQQHLESQDSIKHLVTPKGMHAELFVDESSLQGKPIAMNWDEQGRLWICETVDYPHDLTPENRGRDHIRICEDTDGDGLADKFTLFAEGLNIPTAITFHRGGAVVQNGAETIYLKDTNGDDRADEKTVLMSNWNMNDTHGGVSNFRRGLDNWIWAMQGYNSSSPIINGVLQQNFRMGFFRFRLSQKDPPVVEALEFIRSTNNNTWGLGITEEGLIFGSTANRNPSVFMPIPNRYYERISGWAPETLAMISDTHLFHPITENVRQVDHHGGYTAAAGHAIYTARNYPQHWWNRTAFVCGPTGHLVGTFVLKPEGAGFTSKNPFNLLASDNEWTAPIMAEVGPDGNVWVIDWYNYIVQHNPTPLGFETGPGHAYLTDLRDKRFGRVYRIVPDQHATTGKYSPDSLAEMTNVELVNALGNSTMQVRLTAQRVLIERNAVEVIPQLIKLIENHQVDEIGLNVAAIHALQTLAGLGQILDEKSQVQKIIFAALSHPSTGVRINALRLLSDSPDSVEAIQSAGCLQDTEPQVVLAALLAISDMPNQQVGNNLARLATQSSLFRDKWLTDAFTSAAGVHSQSFLPEFLAASSNLPMNDQQLKVIQIVAEHTARNRPDAAEIAIIIEDAVGASSEAANSLIEGMLAGWPRAYKVQLSETASQNLLMLLDQMPNDQKLPVIRLAKLWGSEAFKSRVSELTATLLKQIVNPEANDATRIETAVNVISFAPDNQEVVESIAELMTPNVSQKLAKGLITALGRSEANNCGETLIELLSSVTPSLRNNIVQTLLGRPATTQLLLTTIEKGDLLVADLSILQRQALTEHPNPEIRKRANDVFAAHGETIDPNRDALIAAKLPLIEQQGNLDHGKVIFTKNCAICHKYQTEGKDVGPNLTGMVVHPKAELLTHILDPNRSVEANYRMYTVLTVDGIVVNGLLAAESRTTIEVVDVEGKRHTILRDEIEDLRASRKSLMPEGLEKSINDQGLIDLLEYMTAAGQYVPLPIDRVATTISTQGMFYNRDNLGEAIDFKDWSPKEFKGIPFLLTDPNNNSRNNVIMLNGSIGPFTPKLPKSVSLPCNTPANAIHFLGGVGGWSAREPGNQGLSVIVRLHYADGETEDHQLINGQHFADYNGPFEVPQSQLAFRLGGSQVRYLSVQPKRKDMIKSIELIKGTDHTAPLFFAVTVEPVKSR